MAFFNASPVLDDIDPVALDHATRCLSPRDGAWEIDRLDGGRSNDAYRLSHRSRPAAVLRIYRRNPEQASKEVGVLRHLRGSVPVPSVIDADVDGMIFGAPHTVLTWVEGVMLSEALETASQVDIRALAEDHGRVLAKIGLTRFPRCGLLNGDMEIVRDLSTASEAVIGHVEACLRNGPAGGRLGADLSERAWTTLLAHKALLASIDGDNRLVHADFSPSNLIVARGERGWRCAGVIDWEFTYAGSQVADLANLSRRSGSVWSSFLSQMVASFEEAGGNVPDDWWRAARLIDIMNLCDLLNAPTVDAASSDEYCSRMRGTVAELS